MNRNLILAQLVSRGEILHLDTKVLDYCFAPIFNTFIAGTYDYHILEPEDIYHESDILYEEIDSLFNMLSNPLDYSTVEKLVKHRIICCNTTKQPGQNVILDNFRPYYVIAEEDYWTLECNIHYMNSGYEYQGVVDGILIIMPDRDNYNLYLDTSYGVFNLHVEAEPK